jgi:hypothetical protein
MSLLRRKRAAPPLLAPIATQSMAARPLPAGANVNRNRAGARVDSAAWLRAILTAPVYDIARRCPPDSATRCC